MASTFVRDARSYRVLSGLGMGLDEFSTSPVQLPIVKQVIRSIEHSFAKSVAEQALKLRTGKEVEAFLMASLNQVAPALVE